MKKLNQFYQKHIYSKSELFLSLVALILALVILVITLASSSCHSQGIPATTCPTPTNLSIGSNLPDIK